MGREGMHWAAPELKLPLWKLYQRKNRQIQSKKYLQIVFLKANKGRKKNPCFEDVQSTPNIKSRKKPWKMCKMTQHIPAKSARQPKTWLWSSILVAKQTVHSSCEYYWARNLTHVNSWFMLKNLNWTEGCNTKDYIPYSFFCIATLN